MTLTRLLVLIGCVALSGCAKPEYLVKGLTLPPGSTVKSKTESKETSGTAGEFFDADDGMSVVVAFDNAGGWQTVSAHFDQQLKGLGFILEEQPDMAGMEKQYPGMSKLMESMRKYNHESKRYGVVVQDMAVVLGDSMKKLKQSGAGVERGQFMLVVSTPK